MTNRTESIEEEAGSTILLRETEKKLPKSWRHWLIGRPLPTADAPHQTIGKAIGLAVFAGDALSSVAYAPQETLVILAAAGAAGFSYAFPVAVADYAATCFALRPPWQPPRMARCEPASDCTSRTTVSIREIFRACCDRANT